jgi:molybdopterin biosynthesis enzyme
MRSVEEHLSQILDTVQPLPPYEQPLLEALGLPICEDVSSGIDLPSFDNSAMDGYAVYAEDLAGASESSAVTLPVVGESAAGQTKAYALSRGHTVKIMTGAPMPTGADSVVPIEWTDGGRAQVAVRRQPRLGEHVRPRGDDIRAGDSVIEEGTSIGPREAMILAATGREGPPTAASRGDLDRFGAAGAGLVAGVRLHLRLQLVRVGGLCSAGGCDRVPRRDRERRPSGADRHAFGPAGPG